MQKSLMTVSLIAVGVIAATAVTTARSRSSLRADRVASTEQSLVREAAPFNRLVHNRADELRLELSRLASTHAPGERAPMAFDSESFDGMAWIEPDAAAETSGEWTTKWISQGSNIDASWLQTLPLKNLHDGDAVFVRHGTGDTATEGLLITAESFAPGATVVEGQGHRIVLFGVLNQNAFAGLVDDWVGSSRIAQIFDEKGVVLAHTNRRTVGAQLKEEGVVRAMASGKRTSASGVFDDSEGRPLVAQAERIPQTNLRISLSVPQRLLDQTIAGTVQTVFWLSLIGFSLLAAFAYWVYLRLLAAPSRAATLDDEADHWSDISASTRVVRTPVAARGLLAGAKTAFANASAAVRSAEELPTSLRALEIPATIRVSEKASASAAANGIPVRSGLAARIAEAKGEAPSVVPEMPPLRVSETSSYSYDEPLVAQAATPVLTFDDIEIKAKANVKEILDRSAAIRARLNLDFVEDFTGLPAAPESAPLERDRNQEHNQERQQMNAIANEIADQLAHEKSVTGAGSIADVDWTANLSPLTDFAETESEPAAPAKAGFMRKPHIKDKIKKQTERNL